ncbi:MAG: alpha/beta hydrolase-fold protein [Pseudomonadales bacterium]|jgi:hypothetical protein|nr:alpha/beta hydrolase-fold protein [Kiritimatiellia bacterium]MDP6973225.1 alpha/beta hydrolase-fold protein [Pseudomonadales bacterium]
MFEYETFDLKAKHIDQVFRIQIAYPVTYNLDPEAQFPVMYVTDGDLSFGLGATCMMLGSMDLIEPGVSPAIIVGVGYDDPSQMSVLRVRDFTPENSVDDWFADSYIQMAGRRAESGGADAFIDFMVNELHPEILSRCRVQGDTAALMGDSYGGLFTFYNLLKGTPLFDRLWLGSPGVLGCGHYLLDLLPERLEAGFEQPTRVFASLGELERTGSIGEAFPEEIYQDLAGSYAVIDKHLSACSDPNLRYEGKEFEGETHSSVVPAAFSRAYRFLMRND